MKVNGIAKKLATDARYLKMILLTSPAIANKCSGWRVGEVNSSGFW
jgi:hypothetical protein